ncbi:hypothetical protein LSH36_545g02004 [Paralvinella palmiformis]|uniref:Uncharacterized protein n=1 Tax=Paralvinella palmiformis TaxID=53620 RepID=A0AAD9J6V9_9ANNE|nr:hypothetical protein LSH36_545g02004 [Paralvinella palmiformis]
MVYGVLVSQQDPENGGKFVGLKPSNISLFYDDQLHSYKIVMSRQWFKATTSLGDRESKLGHMCISVCVCVWGGVF